MRGSFVENYLEIYGRSEMTLLALFYVGIYLNFNSHLTRYNNPNWQFVCFRPVFSPVIRENFLQQKKIFFSISFMPLAVGQNPLPSAQLANVYCGHKSSTVVARTANVVQPFACNRRSHFRSCSCENAARKFCTLSRGRDKGRILLFTATHFALMNFALVMLKGGTLKFNLPNQKNQKKRSQGMYL